MDRQVVSVPEQQYADALEGVGGIDVVLWADPAERHPRADDVTVFVPPYTSFRPPAGFFESLPNLRFVQTLTAGYDNLVDAIPDGVILCNGKGIHETSTAEMALTLILAALRDVPEFVRAQDEQRWVPMRTHDALADRKVLIVGYGAVGVEIARRLVPFEVEVTAMATRERPGDGLVDRVLAIETLPQVIGDYDVVVLIVPLSPSTRGLVDAALLERMKDGALLANLARGPVVVTDDLVAACSTGRIRAVLDVTDPEPLPAGHPLWSTPGVLISPHVGGASTAMAPRAKRLLVRQCEAIAAGREPENVIAL